MTDHLPDISSRRLSLIVPVFNEEDAIPLFMLAIGPVITAVHERFSIIEDVEILFVNDGSTDRTYEIVHGLSTTDKRVKMVALSRNFGKEAALSAGMRYATGKAIIPIDVDLQDPPHVILDLLQEWVNGAQVVDAVRVDRTSDSFVKRVTASAFYRIYNLLADRKIPANVGDFRLLDRDVVTALAAITEHSRFNKALFSWVGFRRAEVPFERHRRSAGQGKWRYWRLWNFALDGLISSSTAPLRMWTYVGALIALAAFLYAGYIIVSTLIYGAETPGYASLITVILFLGGLNLLSLGIMGEYVGRIAIEVRGRPLYIVASTVGL